MKMKVEIRGNSVRLDGYVNVHSRDSRMLPSPRGQFVEQIMPNAFSDALNRTDNVDLLFNHNEQRKLGSIKDGNLELFEDVVGLRAICTVTDDDVVDKAKNGELRGWSFGFIATEQRWAEDNGIQRRYVDGLELLEVSILDCTPAYTSTTIEARGVAEKRFEEVEMTVEEINEVIADSGQEVEPSVEVSEDSEIAEDEPTVEEKVEEIVEGYSFNEFEIEIEIMRLKGRAINEGFSRKTQ